MSLKIKAISGFTWSFSENIITTISNFVIGIILARLLMPEDFGLVGIVFVFLSFITVLTEGGFSTALIQKKDCTQQDFSSVFYLNLFFAFAFYLLLFLSAPLLASYFNQPLLTPLIRYSGLSMIINSISTVQGVVLSKKVDFKSISIITISSTLLGGVLAIVLAFYDFKAWSLVYRALFQAVFSTLLFYAFSTWRPTLVFAMSSIRSLFSFGSKLMLGNLLDKAFQNVFYFVIGKVYSPAQLGFYSRADLFSKIPSQNLLGVVQKVSFPILVELKGNDEKLRSGYKSLIQNTMFISFLAMFAMAASAESIVIMLIGEVWRPSIIYLQLLCFSGVLFPLHALNLNMITLYGRSDILLRLEIIKKLMLVPVLLLGIYYSIEYMLIGMIFFSLAAYFLNAWYASLFVNYSIGSQLADLMPSFLHAAIAGVAIAFIGRLSLPNYWVTFALQAIAGLAITIMIGEVARIKPYLEMKGIVLKTLGRKI